MKRLADAGQLKEQLGGPHGTMQALRHDLRAQVTWQHSLVSTSFTVTQQAGNCVFRSVLINVALFLQ